jgi:hypothetical protein
MGQVSETDKYLTKQLNDISKSDKMSTFCVDNLLPSLPLPTLEETLNVYLESLKPFLNQLEFLETEQSIHNFKNGIGKKLQFFLLEKAKRERNWVNSLNYFIH